MGRKPYFKPLMTYVEQEYKTQTCFPPFEKIMNAMALTPFDQVKWFRFLADGFQDGVGVFLPAYVLVGRGLVGADRQNGV